MYTQFSKSLIVASSLLLIIFFFSYSFNEKHNLYFNKLKPSTWLTEFINFNGSNNKFEIIYNSKMLSKNILKYREIYNFLLLSEYDEVTKLNNNEIKELY